MAERLQSGPTIRQAMFASGRPFLAEISSEVYVACRNFFKKQKWTKWSGDEEFYCYRPDRRIRLMGCCVSLLTVSLLTSGVAMLPAWVLWYEEDVGGLKANLDRHWVIGGLSLFILVLTLGAFVWL